MEYFSNSQEIVVAPPLLECKEIIETYMSKIDKKVRLKDGDIKERLIFTTIMIRNLGHDKFLSQST